MNEAVRACERFGLVLCGDAPPPQLLAPECLPTIAKAQVIHPQDPRKVAVDNVDQLDRLG